jgi:hypothetical protein
MDRFGDFMDQCFVRCLAEAPLGAVGFVDRLLLIFNLCKVGNNPGSACTHRVGTAY